jgi:hypothetical protein
MIKNRQDLTKFPVNPPNKRMAGRSLQNLSKKSRYSTKVCDESTAASNSR